VHHVVALLAANLVDELAERRERRRGDRLEPGGVGGVVEITPGDCHRPVAPAVVEEPGVAVLVGRPVVGDGVSVLAVVAELREQLVQRLGVAKLVLGQRAHGDVLLEDRGDAGPLGVRKTDDELVVGHRQQERVEAGLELGREVAGRGERRADRGHFARAFGLGLPDCSRAAASFSRIT
jgi:hypothetical protein